MVNRKACGCLVANDDYTILEVCETHWYWFRTVMCKGVL